MVQWGQEVGGVVAVDENTARRVSAMVKIDYEVYKSIIDSEEAVKPGAVPAGTRPDRNYACPSAWFEESLIKPSHYKILPKTFDFYGQTLSSAL